MPARARLLRRLVVLSAPAVVSAACGFTKAGHIASGDRHFEKGEIAAAIDEYKAAESMGDLTPAAVQRLGLAYTATTDRRAAISYLERARAAAPHDSTTRLALGAQYLADGKADAAASEANAVLEDSPNSLAALNLAGSARLGKKDPAGAIELYRRIKVAAPTDPRAEYLLGVGFMARGDKGNAERHLEAALIASPTYLEPLTELVEMRLADKQFDRAISRIKQQIATVGDSATLNELLAIAYLSAGSTVEAREVLLKVIRINPRYMDPYVRLSELYRSEGKFDAALTVVDRALSVDPDNLSIRFVQGATWEAKGDREKAEFAYAQALRINPRFATAANNLASLLLESDKNMDRAYELAKSARTTEPENPAIADTYGWALFKRGDLPGAIQSLTEASAKLPDEPTVSYHLGMAQAKAGDTVAARRALTRSVSAPGSFPDKELARKALAALR